jgi:hypothetical protein
LSGSESAREQSTRPACPPGRPPPTASLRRLLDALHDHQGKLVDARHGIGDPVPTEQLARHVVALLAVEHAIADRVLASRWVTVADALTYGATMPRLGLRRPDPAQDQTFR